MAETNENAQSNQVEQKDGDWYVNNAFECFLKDRTDDMEPLSVIRDFYEKNASPELKAKNKEDRKTVEGAYEFMCEVSNKAGGKSISDSVGLSICMHYFQDVPALPDFEPVLKEERDAKIRKETEEKNKALREKQKAEAKNKKSAASKKKADKAEKKTKKDSEPKNEATQEVTTKDAAEVKNVQADENKDEKPQAKKPKAKRVVETEEQFFL